MQTAPNDEDVNVIKLIIFIKDGKTHSEMQIENSTKLEAMMLVSELETRKHDVVHELEDDYNIEWSEDDEEDERS